MTEIIKAYRNNHGGVEQYATTDFQGFVTRHMNLAGHCLWLTLDTTEEEASTTFTRYVKVLNSDWTYANLPTPRDL